MGTKTQLQGSSGEAQFLKAAGNNGTASAFK